MVECSIAHSTAPQNEVFITLDRHSGNLLAGNHKGFVDTGKTHAGMTKGNPDIYFCGVVLRDGRCWTGKPPNGSRNASSALAAARGGELRKQPGSEASATGETGALAAVSSRPSF